MEFMPNFKLYRPDNVDDAIKIKTEHAEARYVAGGPLAANIMKCDLKPVSREDYGVAFTDAEWTRLQEVFPDGVCDWSEPGSYTGVVANGSFGPSPVNLVYDITDEVSD
jgi:hypothetical protein